MIAKIFQMLFRNFPKLKSKIWKKWYDYLAKSYQRNDWIFRNNGYAFLADQSDNPILDVADESNRMSLQLYHHLTRAIDFDNLKVLKVGCGRGRGADYIMRYRKPVKMVGVDFLTHAINFCIQRYHVPGLSFQVRNAESLPFANESFDVVINVDSPYCYSSVDNFLNQVNKVRENGYLLFSDFWCKGKIDALRESLYQSNLTLISEIDITKNIVKALELENERKTALIQKTIHKPFVKTFLEFAGTTNSKTREQLKNRETIYMSAVLQKVNNYVLQN